MASRSATKPRSAGKTLENTGLHKYSMNGKKMVVNQFNLLEHWQDKLKTIHLQNVTFLKSLSLMHVIKKGFLNNNETLCIDLCIRMLKAS